MPDHGDDGDIDVGKDVRRHRDDAVGAEDQNQAAQRRQRCKAARSASRTIHIIGQGTRSRAGLLATSLREEDWSEDRQTHANCSSTCSVAKRVERHLGVVFQCALKQPALPEKGISRAAHQAAYIGERLMATQIRSTSCENSMLDEDAAPGRASASPTNTRGMRLGRFRGRERCKIRTSNYISI